MYKLQNPFGTQYWKYCPQIPCRTVYKTKSFKCCNFLDCIMQDVTVFLSNIIVQSKMISKLYIDTVHFLAHWEIYQKNLCYNLEANILNNLLCAVVHYNVDTRYTVYCGFIIFRIFFTVLEHETCTVLWHYTAGMLWKKVRQN